MSAVRATAALLVLLAVVGCAPTDAAGDGDGETGLNVYPACTRAIDATRDAQEGVTNDAEFRAEWQQVVRDARDTRVEGDALAVMQAINDADGPVDAELDAMFDKCVEVMEGAADG